MVKKKNKYLLDFAQTENVGPSNRSTLVLRDKSVKNTSGKPVSRGEMNLVTTVMVGVIIVFLIAFLAMQRDNSAERTQALGEKDQSYQELRSSYHEQTKELYELRLELQQTKNDLTNALDKKADK